eukprot:COSAG02_NODE_2281_length_9231_cov_15.017959_3_plen_156_part_00
MWCGVVWLAGTVSYLGCGAAIYANMWMTCGWRAACAGSEMWLWWLTSWWLCACVRAYVGESHCKGVGCIIDGVPSRLALTEADIQPQLTRRRPGQSVLTTPRDEADKVSPRAPYQTQRATRPAPSALAPVSRLCQAPRQIFYLTPADATVPAALR